MIPAPFAYQRPQSLQEAIGLLARHGQDARVVAGGHSLIPMMKLRLAKPVASLALAASMSSPLRPGDWFLAVTTMGA